MSEEQNNPHQQLILVGKATRFGQPGGPDPSAAAHRMHEVFGPRVSVRDAMRRLVRVELVAGKIPSYDELAYVFGSRELSIGEATAVRIFRDALNGCPKAQKQVLDQIDGPVPKVSIKADVSLAELIATARKELRDESASNRKH